MVVVGVENTLSVYGPILPSFRDIVCVANIADLVYLDYYFFLSYSYISLTV